MSDYGPPPGPPAQGPPQGQPPYGPPGGGYGQPQGSQAPKAPKAPMDRSAMLGYAAAALGLLSFVWGFLDWLSIGNSSGSGYATLGQAVVGLSVAAGLVAGGAVLEKKSLGTVPAALAVAAALVALGVLVSHGDPDASIGLILAFITTLVQAGVCVFAYLESSRGSGSGLSLSSGRGGSSGSSSGSSGGSSQSCRGLREPVVQRRPGRFRGTRRVRWRAVLRAPDERVRAAGRVRPAGRVRAAARLRPAARLRAAGLRAAGRPVLRAAGAAAPEPGGRRARRAAASGRVRRWRARDDRDPALPDGAVGGGAVHPAVPGAG